MRSPGVNTPTRPAIFRAANHPAALPIDQPSDRDDHVERARRFAAVVADLADTSEVYSMTRANVARAIGISPQYLTNHIARGTAPPWPQVRKLESVAVVFGMLRRAASEVPE